ncbi:hypothetical protein D6D13_07553 [Aureobasidium pullulans]|uniref:Uncharacterized protein n=1 Tax=Aureobasidium pullulans TaxID=5580 RepID=A0A4S9CD26_AURPU|nr:hypothetical protein D6D13_07553 [Aureobasidium pullulans]
MPSTRSLVLLSLALLLWALAAHKGARIWVWWIVALALAILAQGTFCKSPSPTGLMQGANRDDSYYKVVLESSIS